MTNPNPDLEAYVLGELAEPERKRMEQYLAANGEAAAEVERLRLVISAVKRLPEEEPPRRIAFVSDKVFEPRWYHALWSSWPRAAFASSLALAAAIVAHGVIATPPPVASIPSQQIAAQVEAGMAKRVDAAVARMRAEADSKSATLVAGALAEAEKKFALERQADRLAVEAGFELLRKQMNRMVYLASNQTGGER
ncbi:MAG: hypothetical protein HY235_18680 [Acidobacteria bacterium]|nr:hypothetical protein [Acidobacteriota bacterium]